MANDHERELSPAHDVHSNLEAQVDSPTCL
jgi:hypothetical protein